MKTVNLEERRVQLAKENDTIPEKVECYFCKHWGYNCGKILSAYSMAQCQKTKGKRTVSYNWCKLFEKTT